jgi:hypothetical protein
VTLRWTATGDDLDTGTASSYEIRVSTAPIDQASFDAATPVASAPSPLPPGGAEIFEVTGLAPSTTWHFAVRALDEWRNAGPVSNSPSETTLPPPLFASSPATFSGTLLTGEATTRALTLRNAGVGTLDWRIPVQPVQPWLTASPSQGRLGPGESAAVTVTLNASWLPGGSYTGSVDVETNDPAMPVAAHPVFLDVMDAPVVEVSPPFLDFGDVFAGFSSSLPVTVMNTGTLDLHVGRIASADPDVTAVPSSLTLIPGESFDLSVLYTPSSPGSLGDVLEIQSDAPLTPTVTVPLAGRAVSPPGIRVSPAFLGETLPSGQTGSRSLSISNTGAGDLSVSLSTELVPEGSGAPTGLVAADGSPVQLANGGFESGTFQGWTATSNGLPELTPWTVLSAGGGFFANSSPREGSFSALNGFDGEAGLEYVLRREIPLPAGALLAALSYYDRIQFDGQGQPSALPRIYEASLQDPAGITLEVFVHEEILLAGQGTTDLGWQRRWVDLSPYAGLTIHLVITETIPEAFTGPAQIEFDDFRIEGEAIPEWLTVGLTRGRRDPGRRGPGLRGHLRCGPGGHDPVQWSGADRLQ